MKQIRPPLNGTPLPHPTGSAFDATGNDHPADELAKLRECLKQLHQREAELLSHFRNFKPSDLASGAACASQALIGSEYEVKPTQYQKRVFDASLLPQSVLANPAYYRDERITVFPTKPVASPVTHRLS